VAPAAGNLGLTRYPSRHGNGVLPTSVSTADGLSDATHTASASVRGRRSPATALSPRHPILVRDLESTGAMIHALAARSAGVARRRLLARRRGWRLEI
jgi:hypothetical protein